MSYNSDNKQGSKIFSDTIFGYKDNAIAFSVYRKTNKNFDYFDLDLVAMVYHIY